MLPLIVRQIPDLACQDLGLFQTVPLNLHSPSNHNQVIELMEQNLTIRNLTSLPILIERYEIHDRIQPIQSGGRFTNISHNVTSLFTSNSKAPSLACRTASSFSLRIEACSTCKVPIAPANLPQQILSLFLSVEEQQYQVNILHARCHSQYLMRVDGRQDPDHKHITFYHPDHHHLLFAYRNSYKSWMQSLRDDSPLSCLSIPGTHNSPTYHKALPSVRCQCVPVREQLRKGIRFLDIRVQPLHHGLPLRAPILLVHSVFPISLTGQHYFRSLVNEVLQFLEENPSETIIMSVKREGTGSCSDEHLSRILHLHYAHDDRKWFTAPRIPYLGEVRGKIVLFRRFRLDHSLASQWGGTGWGIDASIWADNVPHSICPSGDVCFQDFYEVLETHNITEKIGFSIDHLKRAAGSEPPMTNAACHGKQPFHINFLTASNFWKMGCWPDRIAAQINPAIVEYLCLQHNNPIDEDRPKGIGSTGIVICDWVGDKGNWDIVRCVIGMNAPLERRS